MWTNSDYGALDISVSRVVFVHGSVDPWHALGITNSTNNDAPAIFIRAKHKIYKTKSHDRSLSYYQNEYNVESSRAGINNKSIEAPGLVCFTC
ncbi:hypothetical protein O3G_MSEX005891 [Manduca sexta]|uniref:Uncharacterized protein n=1 Tax=Manduca sexta TaxID=7130 RepID=A0A921Z1Q6_MANSE|nr:hypothetical protein O3G_MSEX005891 [Manduca sexta]